MNTVRIKKIGVDHNNILYSKDALEKAIEKYDGKRIYGQLGGNQDPSLDTTKISHVCENLRIDGGYVIADVEILSTPMGKIVGDNIENGRFGISCTAKIDEGVVSEICGITSIDFIVDEYGKEH
jgi:hypothetical protein